MNGRQDRGEIAGRDVSERPGAICGVEAFSATLPSASFGQDFPCRLLASLAPEPLPPHKAFMSFAPWFDGALDAHSV